MGEKQIEAPQSYPILQVAGREAAYAEQMGTKRKFWFRLNDDRWLYKVPRQNTGEHWAEKVAAEVGRLVGIDVAQVELASLDGNLGSASKSFVNTDEGVDLIHGNELLAGFVPEYDKAKRWNQCAHTWSNITSVLSKLFGPGSQEYASAVAKLGSYFFLDALIANVDRHHENWGVLKLGDQRNPTFRVAPSFDHASSLGRELRDNKKKNLLENDQVGTYVARGSGGIYLNSTDERGANPLKLVQEINKLHPGLFDKPLVLLKKLGSEDVSQILKRVPSHLMTDESKEFAEAIIAYSISELRNFV